MARVYISLFVVLISVYLTEQAYFLKQDYIDKINDQVTTWKAGVNFDPNTPEDRIVRLLGSKGLQHVKDNADYIQYKTHDVAYDLTVEIPERFDAREEWKQCWTIGSVRNQGNCGSSWAVSTSSALSDRWCIFSDGFYNQYISVEELLFCCMSCGSGCDGGTPKLAWRYIKKYGLVTGGKYASKVGCQPYSVPPCVKDKYGSSNCTGKPTEKGHGHCRRFCYGDEEIDFGYDHKCTKDEYYLSYDSIQRDIMTYGPVEASFDVYDDFPNYKSGVYVKSENASRLRGHSVKLIGWGKENGVPYWLMINSWGEDWGDNGLFKIRRGTNECGIDSAITGGVSEFCED